jgi:hypothetical protein
MHADKDVSRMFQAWNWHVLHCEVFRATVGVENQSLHVGYSRVGVRRKRE